MGAEAAQNDFAQVAMQLAEASGSDDVGALMDVPVGGACTGKECTTAYRPSVWKEARKIKPKRGSTKLAHFVTIRAIKYIPSLSARASVQFILRKYERMRR